MLAALVVVALAFVALSTALALVSSATRTQAADETSAKVLALAECGLADAQQRVRWGWAGRQAVGVIETLPTASSDDGSYAVTIERLAAPSTVPMPIPSAHASSSPALAPGAHSYRIVVSAACGRARRRLQADVLSSPIALPRGLAVAESLLASDLVELTGCGMYVGGDVRGREFVALSSPSGRDEAVPELFGAPGVHSGAGIYVAGGEEHEVGVAPQIDSDPHAGAAPPPQVCRLPASATLGDLAVHASDTAGAFVGETLLLDALPAAPDTSGAAGSADGVIVVVRAPDPAGLHLEGSRALPPAACALTLVVEGDATVTAPAALSGALIVTGALHVEAPLTVRGSLAAGALVVASPLRVELGPEWADRPPPGALSTRVTWWDDSTPP